MVDYGGDDEEILAGKVLVVEKSCYFTGKFVRVVTHHSLWWYGSNTIMRIEQNVKFIIEGNSVTFEMKKWVYITWLTTELHLHYLYT